MPSFTEIVKVLVKHNLRLAWRRYRLASLALKVFLYGGALLAVYIGIDVAMTNGGNTQDTINYVISIIMLFMAPIMVVNCQMGVLVLLLGEMMDEKESKMKLMQIINGVSVPTYFFAAFCNAMICGTAVSVVLTIIFAVTSASSSNPLLIFLALQFNMMQMYAVAVCIASFCEKAKDSGGFVAVASFLPVVPMLLGGFLEESNELLFYGLGFLPTFGLSNLLQSVVALESPALSPQMQIVPGRGWSWGDTFFESVHKISDGDAERGIAVPAAGWLFLLLPLQTLFWLFIALRCEIRTLGGERLFHRISKSSPEVGSDTEIVLSISNMVKTFRRGKKDTFNAVDGLSLDVSKGEIFALLGHNGAGKTTAVQCLTGSVRMTAGNATVAGFSVLNNITAVRQRLGFCPQDNPLFPDITVDEHLQLFAGLRGVEHGSDSIEVLQALGIGDKRYSQCKALSGGQKRRLWVATSLLGRPPVIFMDEPTSGMDPQSRRELWDMMLDLKQKGHAIVFTTHYLEEADTLADRKAVLNKGKIQAFGTSLELKHQFGTGYHLRLAVKPDATDEQQQAIANIVRQFVPDAQDEDIENHEMMQAGDADKVLAFMLPFAAADSFGEMLTTLDGRRHLGILECELAMTSLDEVFMALEQQPEEGKEAGAAQVNVQVEPARPESWTPEARSEVQTVKILVYYLASALFVNKGTVMWTLLFPCFLIIYGDFMFAGITQPPPRDSVGNGSVFMLGLAGGIAAAGTTIGSVQDRVKKISSTMRSQGVSALAGASSTLILEYRAVLVTLFAVASSGITEQKVVTNGRVLPAIVAALLAPLPVIVCCLWIATKMSTVEGATKTAPTLQMLLGGIPGIAVGVLMGIEDTKDVAMILHAIFSVVNPFYALPGAFIGLRFCDAAPEEGGGGHSAIGWFSEWPVVLPIACTVLQTAVFAGLVFNATGPTAAECGAPLAGNEDDDVTQEADAVGKLSPEDAGFMYRNLRHAYKTPTGPVPAVQGISLAVRPGECFALLGPNGAGKTTTLACLTGEVLRPSSGDVFVAGHHVASNFGLASQHMGNCPQVDAIIDVLTGRQQLMLMGRLKGMPHASAVRESNRLLAALGFSDADADKAAEKYSGGMKRKLCLASALIGSRKALFLDEPSAAVDAAAKRYIWKVIKNREPNQSVIVTTHSMEEAEALADRLAIQVKGRLRCLGSPMHIKSRYGVGYQLELRIPLDQGQQDRRLERVNEFIQKLDLGAELVEQHHGRFLLQLPKSERGMAVLGRVLTLVQKEKAAMQIDAFAVSQPTLEQVFLRFAKEQESVQEQ